MSVALSILLAVLHRDVLHTRESQSACNITDAGEEASPHPSLHPPMSASAPAYGAWDSLGEIWGGSGEICEIGYFLHFARTKVIT